MSPEKKIKDRLMLWGLIAVSSVFMVPLVMALMGEATQLNDRYKEEGMVGRGVVVDVRAESETYEGRRGRMTTRDNHFIDVRHELSPSTSYADFVRGGENLPQGEVQLSASSNAISSSAEEAAAHRPGQEVAVVVLPDKPFEPRLYTAVRDYTETGSYLLVLGGLLVTLLCGWRALVAWRELQVHRREWA